MRRARAGASGGEVHVLVRAQGLDEVGGDTDGEISVSFVRVDQRGVLEVFGTYTHDQVRDTGIVGQHPAQRVIERYLTDR